MTTKVQPGEAERYVPEKGLTAVPGIQVGHWTNLEAGTGCTVVLCPQGATAGVDVRGGAPGSRELELLNPTCLVEQVHAIMLAGGSAFGLAAADGAMRWLEERGIGYDVGVARVPIVPSVILFDLGVGSAKVRPDAAAGYAACEAANDGPVVEGTVGAGTGATVGKLFGITHACKGGVGSASRMLEDGVIIAALAVVNAIGDVVDPATQRVVAGARNETGDGFADAMRYVTHVGSLPLRGRRWGGHTTLAVVATNVALSNWAATKVAQMAHDGLARAIRPVHTLIDGDVVFALSMGDRQGDVSLVGAVAAEVVSEAIVRGVMAAESLHGIPSAREVVSAE
jgi:L-aminopeptidase/D-esterase-like protein